MIQNCIVSRSCLCSARARLAAESDLLLKIFCRRIIARIDRVMQECGLVVRPELADVGIRPDNRVYEPSVALCHLADVDVADDVAKFVEFDETTYCLRITVANRGHQSF